MEQHKIDLSKYRLEKAKEHLMSAEDLLKNNHLKDSISRSYYAIFTTARAISLAINCQANKNSL
ncbi:MAG: HEPN domain-containing protein [Nitrospirota bacterium]